MKVPIEYIMSSSFKGRVQLSIYIYIYNYLYKWMVRQYLFVVNLYGTINRLNLVRTKSLRIGRYVDNFNLLLRRAGIFIRCLRLSCLCLFPLQYAEVSVNFEWEGSDDLFYVSRTCAARVNVLNLSIRASCKVVTFTFLLDFFFKLASNFVYCRARW